MGITLEEVLTLEAFAGARVVAGRRSLRNCIRTVTVGEVPNSSQYLSGGELVLTSFYLYREMPGSVLAAVIQTIADAGAAGLVYKPGAVRALSGQPLQIAEARGLPIVEVPEDRRWPVLIESVLDRIKEMERATLHRAWEIQHDLIHTVLAGGGLRGLCASLGRQFGCQVEVLDTRLRSLAAWAPGSASLPQRTMREGAEAFRAWLGQTDLPARAHSSGDPVQVVPPGQVGAPRMLLPVAVEGRPLGYISLETTLKRLGEVGLMAARETCALAAMEMLKLQEAERAEARTRDQFLHRLLGDSMPLATDDDLPLPYRGAVIVLRSPGWNLEEAGGVPPEPLRAEVIAAARRVADGNAEPFITVVHGDLVVLLPHGDDGANSPQPSEQAGRVRSALQRLWEPGEAPELGIGRSCRTMGDVRQSYRDAVRALESTAARTPDRSRPALHSDTALYNLLIRSPDRADLEQFCQSLMRPLAEHDRKHRADLAGTLLTFLETNRSLTDTAARLHMHRNSVAYRLRKIQDITALDYDNPDQVVTWFLALKLPAMMALGAESATAHSAELPVVPLATPSQAQGTAGVSSGLSGNASGTQVARLPV